MQIYNIDGILVKVYFETHIGRWIATDSNNITQQITQHLQKDSVEFKALKEISKKYNASYANNEFYVFSNGQETINELAHRLANFLKELLSYNKEYYQYLL